MKTVMLSQNAATRLLTISLSSGKDLGDSLGPILDSTEERSRLSAWLGCSRAVAGIAPVSGISRNM
jgi:hypothetical protein